MLITEVVFWLSLSLLFYCYLGYGIILYLLNRLKSITNPRARTMEPKAGIPVSIIVTAYNEAPILARKIANTLAIAYPAELMHIIFVTDGSTDDSNEIVKKFPRIMLLHTRERRGKLAAIKHAMQHVTTPVVIFSDANTELNSDCVNRMLAHYMDKRTGGVAGEKKIIRDKHISAVGEAEGIYWQYESFMKQQDADFNTVVGAAGELFSIRTDLFTQLDDRIILDDFVISMRVCLQGYRIAYEPGAFASELPSASLAEEQKRKIRISAGAYQSIAPLKQALNIFKHPLLCLQYVSRRLFRWVVCPIMLVSLFVTNIILVINHPGNNLYLVFLLLQSLFYILAFIGGLLVSRGKRAGIFAIPFYFVFMNYCLARGFFRFLSGAQPVTWEKAMRQAVE